MGTKTDMGSGGKLWRMIFTALVTAILGLVGWFAADAALRFYSADQDLSSLFSQTRAPLWISTVYRFTFLTASAFFGIALGRLVLNRLEHIGHQFQGMSARDKLALAGGMAIGILLSAIVSIPILITLSSINLIIGVALSLLIGMVVTYLCITAALSLKEEIRFYLPTSPQEEEEKLPDERFKLLDTNVIIDGRVADVARAGFIEGHIYVPGFVLDELQFIADSADNLKRARGRRGLDVLRGMQNELTLTVRTYDRLAPGSDPVDARLVKLAKAMNASIVTNDFNLNKVAELEGVPVLNINELANALKPVVLPGEDMAVLIVKEGREAAQGVGYLDDGTMIVVEGGRRHVGETVNVQVQSVLQTQAGKMIFAHISEDDGGASGGDDSGYHNGGGGNGGSRGNGTSNGYERNVRAYTSSRPRRPVR